MHEPWTLPPPDSVLYSTVAEIFKDAGLDLPSARVVSTSGVARTALVAKVRFLTITAESVFRFAGREMGIKTLPIDMPEKTLPVAVVTLKGRTLTPAAQLFIDCARDVAKLMGARKSSSVRRPQFART